MSGITLSLMISGMLWLAPFLLLPLLPSSAGSEKVAFSRAPSLRARHFGTTLFGGNRRFDMGPQSSIWEASPASRTGASSWPPAPHFGYGRHVPTIPVTAALFKPLLATSRSSNLRSAVDQLLFPYRQSRPTIHRRESRPPASSVSTCIRVCIGYVTG
jgi:hypothetical protein